MTAGEAPRRFDLLPLCIIPTPHAPPRESDGGAQGDLRRLLPRRFSNRRRAISIASHSRSDSMARDKDKLTRVQSIDSALAQIERAIDALEVAVETQHHAGEPLIGDEDVRA